MIDDAKQEIVYKTITTSVSQQILTMVCINVKDADRKGMFAIADEINEKQNLLMTAN